jgi:hypothetical protein
VKHPNGNMFVATCAHVVIDEKAKDITIKIAGKKIQWSKLFISKIYRDGGDEFTRRIHDVAMFKVEMYSKNEHDAFFPCALPVFQGKSSLGQKFSLFGISRAGESFSNCTINTISRLGLLQFLELPPLTRFKGF